MIPYGRQYLDDADIQAVVEVLKGDWLTCGPSIEAFEKKIAEYCGARHVVVVANGTAALHVALLAAGIGEGDQVVTSPNTFLASANCIEYVGAQTRFADMHADSYNLDVEQLKDTWCQQTRAVIAVDFAGQPCDMPEIYSLAKKNRGIVIEDAAHAIGSRFAFDGKEYTVGGHPWADMTTFSFHPVKTITSAEGGAIVTNDDRLAERCRLVRNHGMKKRRPNEPWHYEMDELGYNYRITDLQCALGISQLDKLDDFIARRRFIVAAYDKAFCNEALLVCPQLARTELFQPTAIAQHLYVVQIDYKRLNQSRAEVMRKLASKGVGTQVHYIPVHTQPYYQKKYGFNWGDFPVAETYYEKCLSLPLHPSMSDDDVKSVIAAVKELLG